MIIPEVKLAFRYEVTGSARCNSEICCLKKNRLLALNQLDQNVEYKRPDSIEICISVLGP